MTCKLFLDHESFGFSSTSFDGKQPRCRKCSAIVAADWYSRNKKVHLKRVSENQKKIRAWFKELKSSLKCIQCGESHPACLDFHHRNPLDKKEEVGKMLRNCSKKAILLEIQKCDALCCNCHRKIHFGSVV